MTTTTRDRLGDEEIDRRLRATLAAVMPMLDAPSAPVIALDRPAAIAGQPAASDADPVQVLDLLASPPLRPHRRRFAVLMLAAAAVVALLLGVVPGRSPSGPRLAPSSTEPDTAIPDVASTTGAAEVVARRWYERIRPFLPDGFDQIALTRAAPTGFDFRAVRAATGQVLDVSVTLQRENKTVADRPTDTDVNGTWYEATSGVTLITPDDRMIGVECSMTLLGGGVVGSVTMAGTQRDYCADGPDHAGIDASGRRAMAVALATRFDPAWLDASFGAPTLVPDRAAIAATVAATIPGMEVTGWMTQWDGVVVSTPLGTTDADQRSTQLSAIAGVYPNLRIDPGVVGVAAPDAALLLVVQGDLAAGWIVGTHGTGFQVVTRDVSEANRRRLGTLLERLAGLAAPSDATATGSGVHARTGTFGAGGENGVGELLRLDAPDAPGIAAALGADVPLPPGGSFSLFIDQMHASRNIETDAGVRGSLEQVAACQWIDYWLDSKTVGDTQAMATASDAIAAVPTRPALAATDGGGVVAVWRAIADAVRRDDLAALPDHLAMCAGPANQR